MGRVDQYHIGTVVTGVCYMGRVDHYHTGTVITAVCYMRRADHYHIGTVHHIVTTQVQIIFTLLMRPVAHCNTITLV